MDKALKIALGTVQFGLDYGISNQSGKTTPEEVSKILNLASDLGIQTLDTAIAYGTSEKVLGANDLSSFKVVSKFPLLEGFPSIYNLLNHSLINLNLDSIYGFIGHNAQVFLQNPRYWEQLLFEKQQGRVQKIGVSLYTPMELEQLQALNIIPDIIQVPYNFLDRRFEPYFEELKEKGVEIHTRSAFLQGLFFLPPSGLNPFFDPIIPFLTDLHAQIPLNEDKAAMLLGFCLENSNVDKVVIGINTSRQLELNLRALRRTIYFEPQVFISPSDLREEVLLPSHWPKN